MLVHIDGNARIYSKIERIIYKPKTFNHDSVTDLIILTVLVVVCVVKPSLIRKRVSRMNIDTENKLIGWI